MPLPAPRCRTPITLPDGTEHPGTVFLSQVVDHPGFVVGDFTYASDFDPPQDWATRLAPCLFPTSAEHLRIGRFCQIAHGVRFITSSANHAMGGATTFPFPVFDPDRMASYQPDTRDTHIGHDVWLGISPGFFEARANALPKSLCALNSSPPAYNQDHHRYRPSDARLWTADCDNPG